jgi:hypothetical protein
MSGQWSAHWLYWIAPIVGMLGSMRLYEFLRPASAMDAIPVAPPEGSELPVEGYRAATESRWSISP